VIGFSQAHLLCNAKLPGGIAVSITLTQQVVELDQSPEISHSLAWGEHFRRNAIDQLDIPWHDAIRLSDDQRRILIRSLQDFQLGENSDGRNGLARAAAYGQRIGDPHYAETMRLFFAEEKRHAAYLARYLQIQDEPLIARSWTDFVFRRVRRLMGLETLLTVLLSVELITEVYYRAIRNATRCPTLRAICDQILRDEERHVQVHVERFALLGKGRWRIRVALHRIIWRCFFAGTCLAAWLKHRQAFRLGGYGLRAFWGEAWRRFRLAASADDLG
jgi:hypothetical protein